MVNSKSRRYSICNGGFYEHLNVDEVDEITI